MTEDQTERVVRESSGENLTIDFDNFERRNNQIQQIDVQNEAHQVD